MGQKVEGKTALQILLDKQEIYEVLLRYCRGIDRLDESLLRSVYHPDATDDHGLFKGKASDFIDWALEYFRTKMKLTWHVIMNVLIEVEGDVAYSEAYSVAYHRVKEQKEFDWIVGGRFVDRFERRKGAWKISQRRLVFEWSRKEPATEELGFNNLAGELSTGHRDFNDPVYQR
jgi:hypothetical protein